MQRHNPHRRRAAVLAVALAVLALVAPGRAEASDVRPELISWPNVTQCYDSASGADIYAQPTYRTPSVGYYGVQLVLSTTTGRTIASTAFTAYNRSASPIAIRFPLWNAYSTYTGEARITAWVWKWNGSSYVVVAAESLPCW